MNIDQILIELDEEKDLLVTAALLQDTMRRNLILSINIAQSVFSEFDHLMLQLLEYENRFLIYFQTLKNDFYFLLNMIASISRFLSYISITTITIQ